MYGAERSRARCSARIHPPGGTGASDPAERALAGVPVAASLRVRLSSIGWTNGVPGGSAAGSDAVAEPAVSVLGRTRLRPGVGTGVAELLLELVHDEDVLDSLDAPWTGGTWSGTAAAIG